MRILGIFAAFLVCLSDTASTGPTPAGMAGLRHKRRHTQAVGRRKRRLEGRARTCTDGKEKGDPLRAAPGMVQDAVCYSSFVPRAISGRNPGLYGFLSGVGSR